MSFNIPASLSRMSTVCGATICDFFFADFMDLCRGSLCPAYRLLAADDKPRPLVSLQIPVDFTG
jgi:hypothetical protein